MTASHYREPIKHTCPDIDKYIRSIVRAMVKERDLKNYSERELFDCASSMNAELESCIDYLEGLRNSNDELRQWGILEAKRVDELEQEIETELMPIPKPQIDMEAAGKGILEAVKTICDDYKNKATA